MSPRLGLSQAGLRPSAFVPPNADAFCETFLGVRSSFFPTSSHFHSVPLRERSASRRAPHESGAAAGGQTLVSALPALRVRQAPAGGDERRERAAGAGWHWLPLPGRAHVTAWINNVSLGCDSLSHAAAQGVAELGGWLVWLTATAGPLLPTTTPAFHLSTTTSDQTRQPAEFKHITKRRKRN